MTNSKEKEYNNLKEELEKANKIVASHKDRYIRVQAELTAIEDDLVASKEVARKADEAIKLFEYTQVQSDADEDDRLAEIDRFSGELPRLLKKLETENQLKAEQKKAS